MGPQDNSFSVVALGGLGEIGMNCLVVEAAGKLLIVDCGAMFSSEGLGIDMIHPGFDFLANRRDDIEGVVLTHAHEDHIAGIPFLLRELDVQVYGAVYSLGLLREKMKEFDQSIKPVSHQINPGGRVEIGPFQVKTFPMPHSIIENTGLVIDTPGGRILHTGDFKLNLKAPDRGAEVLARLNAAAEGRVDLMLTDSTGSEEEEVAGEETEVAAALDALVQSAAGRVFVAIFSSNAHRLESVLETARRYDRRVALCGRSVQTHSRVAEESGVLKIPPGVTIPLDKAADLPRNRILIVASGTQGEARSALGRLAEDSHHLLRVEKDDLVILSSRFIPGNELAIGRVIDRLHRLGARVVHRGIQRDIHVSGHGSRQEIRQAIEAVAPRCLMPVHGTYRHLVACASLAREVGVKNILIAADGQTVRCGPDGISLVNEYVPTHRVFIDGGTGLSENAIRDRRVLGSHGVLVVTLKTDASGVLGEDVDVIARGVTKDEALPWLTEQIKDKVRSIVDNVDVPDRKEPDRYRNLIRSGLRKYLMKLISREPYVLVSIIPS
ncbi:MAG: ribonuclease J [Proteobacteria bacterium]|nr:ribonuclease J [Pseudomonadota bacterium]